MLRIGVDVGGTNTDSCIIDVSRTSDENRGILASFKSPTTADVSEGIEAAVRAVLDEARCDPSEIASLTIGTTHFINAVLERDVRRLQKVAVIRLCGPYTQQCPPFVDFPPELKEIMEGYVGYVDGGFQIDGTPIMAMKEEELVKHCNEIKAKGLSNVVVIGVFSPLDSGKQEYAAREIVLRELGTHVNVVCSADIGQIGLLERENASILNASILTFAQRTMRGFRRAMKRLSLSCPLFLTQNDGTLTTAAKAAQLPIRTFASGQTNSMRGASYLAGLDLTQENAKSIIVCDLGGTTCDVGVLLPSGFPRQAAAYIEVGGVRTAFTMPDLLSIGLGGGSRIRHDQMTGRTTVGPDSVGLYITKEALVFGGDVLTATDIAVTLGRADVGDATKVKNVSQELAKSAQESIKKSLEVVIDRMKTSPEPATVLMVGGGSIIAPDELKGVGEIIRPPFFGVANAVGAAMAKVSGDVDTVEVLEGKSLPDVIEKLKVFSIERAIAAGADPERVAVVEVTNLPLTYITNKATRIIIKAAGELSATAPADLKISDEPALSGEEEAPEPPKAVLADAKQEEVFDIIKYRPYINEKREWILSEKDLEFIAEGAYVLGVGGGGSPYSGMLAAKQQLRAGKVLRVVDPDDLPDDALIGRAAFIGAPSVTTERIAGGNELAYAYEALERYMGFTKVAATISDEIGGANGMMPILTGGDLDVPCFDGDLMGRAYPQVDLSLPGTFKIEGAAFPSALADGVGNAVIIHRATEPKAVESMLRSLSTTMGSCAMVTLCPLTRRNCVDYGVVRTVSLSWRIGRAIAMCRYNNDMKAVPKAILQLQGGKCLFIGKIIDVQREVRSGWTMGEFTIAPLKDEEQDETSAGSGLPSYSADDRLWIPFQNENLAAFLVKSDGTKKALCTVPDLISVLDSQSGLNLGTQEYRYGLRVTVIAMAADKKWTQTEIGLTAGGPRRFGLDCDFVSCGEFSSPKSVIAEYETKH